MNSYTIEIEDTDLGVLGQLTVTVSYEVDRKNRKSITDLSARINLGLSPLHEKRWWEVDLSEFLNDVTIQDRVFDAIETHLSAHLPDEDAAYENAQARLESRA